MSTVARERLGLALFIAVASLASFFHALDMSSRLAQTSDSAQSFVEAHSIIGGNVLLSGWHFPIDDYYFTDTLPYALLERLAGSRPVLLTIVPALIYSLFVLAALIASVETTRPLSRNMEVAATLVILLAAPAWIGSWNPLFLSDMHVATVLTAFVALALCARIARSETRNLRFSLALPIIVAATVASDPFALVFAFGPAFVLLVADMFLCMAAPRIRLAFLLLSVGVGVGLLLPFVIAFSGGFTTEFHVLTRFIAPPLIGQNLLALFSGLLTLFGIVPSAIGTGWRAVFLLAVRGAAFAIVIAAVARGVRNLFGRAALFDRLLCAGLLTDLAACALSAQFAKDITPQTIWAGGPPMRFLVPAALFGATLAARQVPEMLDVIPRSRALARGVLGLLALIMLVAGGFLSNVGAQPRWITDDAPTAVARWLERHNLTQGVGEYWSANLITAMSGNTLQVRSVVPLEGTLVPYIWVEDARFYARPPQFMIWRNANWAGVTFDDVRATYLICRTESVAGYRIALFADRTWRTGCGSGGRSSQNVRVTLAR